MSTITIKNLGPIKNITLNLNKINVIIGPQSSGKSTIAKVISFCTWLDKKFTRDGIFKTVEEPSFIDYMDMLKTYHRLSNGYFSESTEIYYDGDEVEFCYNCGYQSKNAVLIGESSPWKIAFKTGSRKQSSKVIYIPSERNFVSAIYNLNEYLRDSDHIQDFVKNWYEAKRKYTNEHRLDILNLGVQYYTEGEDVDKLHLENGKELTLQIASSGLQAVVPLVTLFDYIARGIYNESRPMSVKEQDALANQYKELVKKKRSEQESVSATDLETLFDLIISKNYSFSQFIVEEPEQNLFPKTQRDLMYYMLRLCSDTKRNHRLTITTHSPYILYALNNCMMGYRVKDVMPENEQKELLSRAAWINPKLASVWQIENGEVVSLQNENGLIGNNYFDDSMKEVMDDFYTMISYYDESQD